MISRIETGNAIIIDSGTVIAYSEDSPVKLHVEIAEDFSFSIEISFEDRGGEEKGIRGTVDEKENCIKINCINFGNSLGTSTTKPMELAIHKGKKISMHLWTTFLGQKDKGVTRKIEYSIYREI